MVGFGSELRLSGKADRRVHGAEAGIAAPLDDLEEEAALEGPRVELEDTRPSPSRS